MPEDPTQFRHLVHMLLLTHLGGSTKTASIRPAPRTGARNPLGLWMGGRFAASKWGQMEQGFDGVGLSDVVEYQLHHLSAGAVKIIVHAQRREPLVIICSTAQLGMYLGAAARDNELDD